MRRIIAVWGWIGFLMLAGVARGEVAGTQGKDVAVEAKAVFAARCAECHGETAVRPKGGFGYVTDLKRLGADTDYVVAGNSKDSILWQMVDEGEMPPKGAKNGTPTEDEKKVIQLWIDSLAPVKDGEAETKPAKKPKKQAATQPAVAEEKAGGANAGGAMEKVLTLIGRAHVVSVHFPIALVLAAGLVEAVGVMRGKRLKEVRLLLWLGAASAVGASLLGLLHGYEDGFFRRSTQTFWIHLWLGAAAGVIAVVAAILHEKGERGGGWMISGRVALGLAAVLVGVAGHFGGMMVYGSDYFSW